MAAKPKVHYLNMKPAEMTTKTELKSALVSKTKIGKGGLSSKKQRYGKKLGGKMDPKSMAVGTTMMNATGAYTCQYAPSSEAHIMQPMAAGGQTQMGQTQMGQTQMDPLDDILDQIYTRQYNLGMSSSGSSSMSQTGESMYTGVGGTGATTMHMLEAKQRPVGPLGTRETLDRTGFYRGFACALVLLSIFILGVAIGLPLLLAKLSSLQEQLDQMKGTRRTTTAETPNTEEDRLID